MVCEIQAPLTRRGFLTWVTQVPALKGRPTVKRRDAAENKRLCAQQISPHQTHPDNWDQVNTST